MLKRITVALEQIVHQLRSRNQMHGAALLKLETLEGRLFVLEAEVTSHLALKRHSRGKKRKTTPVDPPSGELYDSGHPDQPLRMEPMQ